MLLEKNWSVDACGCWGGKRFWKGGGKPPTKSQLQREKEKIMRQGELLYKKKFVQVVAAELNDNIDNISEESEESSRSEVYKLKNQDMKTSETIDIHIIKQHEKLLCVTRRSRKFACPCSFNIIRGHDCQDIVACISLLMSLKHETTKVKIHFTFIVKKNTHGNSKDELKLPQKRGPKNKRKSRLISGESVQLQDAILDKSYHKVQIVEIIGNGEIIVDITLANSSKNQQTVQLTDIIGYDDGKIKKNQRSKLIVVKNTITMICDSEYCPRRWKEPYIVPCGSEFKTINREKPEKIPISAFRFNKYASVETGKSKSLYVCTGKTTSTRQIDQRLPLIQAINVTKSILLMKKNILEIKTFQRRSVFPPDDVHIKQRYRLMGVSFCNGNHHIADVRFKNIKKLASIYMMDWERPTVREQCT
ncbi:hypothetical protein C2G38_2165044 [Gigaspora rosea]|uniref:Uncharacterized protein n=1 Tax=Gigaspora rosea TaxID=44941 RepID=A0A397VVN6_9GLOM|nr:hypothetical protein C2G38_2165044 [Gigaspora rosea]